MIHGVVYHVLSSLGLYFQLFVTSNAAIASTYMRFYELGGFLFLWDRFPVRGLLGQKVYEFLILINIIFN